MKKKRVKAKRESQSTDYPIGQLREYHKRMARLEGKQSSAYKSNSILNVSKYFKD